MAFSQSTITQVFPPQRRGGQVYLCWSASSPTGTWFQVYLNQQLAWSGQRLWAWVPVPSGPVRIDVGTVDSGEEQTSFVGSLPSAPTRRVRLTWQSGTYKGIDLAGYRVYGEPTPSAGIDYTSPLSDLTAYPAGILTDGFGLGGFGAGGWGQAASTFSWISNPLAGGSWQFAVVPYDEAGNEGAAQTVTVAISAPPRAPAPFASTTTRLQYSLLAYGQIPFGQLGFGLPQATFAWNPSPQ
jgi:hypothetical protein